MTLTSKALKDLTECRPWIALRPFCLGKKQQKLKSKRKEQRLKPHKPWHSS